MITRTAIITHPTITFSSKEDFESQYAATHRYAEFGALRESMESRPAEKSWNNELQEYTIITYFPTIEVHNEFYYRALAEEQKTSIASFNYEYKLKSIQVS